MVTSSKLRDRLASGFILALLGLAALLCMAPIVNTAAISLSDKAAAAAGWVYFWPVDPTWSSYRTLLSDGQFFASFGISIQRVLLGGAINFVLTVLTAYPLSKETKAFRMRNAIMWFVVFTMLFQGGLIPWYMVIQKLGLMDSIWALVLPGAVPIFNVILLMNFFRSLPKELEEAGVMDGAGPWYMLVRIFLPVSLPALATVTLFTIVGHWNSFFDGLILINSPEKLPLQTYIQTLVVEMSNLNLMNPEDIQRMEEISNRTMNAAKIVVAMIPILLVYPFLQRYFIHGIVMVKE